MEQKKFASRDANGAATLSTGERLWQFLDRREVPVLTVWLLVVAGVALVESRQKPLWFDEIFTLIVADQPNWHDLWRALPADGNPPLMHALVRGAIHLLGPTAMAGRLPELVGFLTSCVLLQVLVRRSCGAVGGLLAVAILSAQPGWSYAFEARPYGLLLMFLLLAMLSWNVAAEREEAGQRRGLALVGLSVGFAGAILVHNVGLFEVGLPLALAEGVRTWRRRRVDVRLLLACAVGLLPLAMTLPLAAQSHRTLLAQGGVPRSAGLAALVVSRLKNAWLSLPLLVDLPMCFLLLCLGWVGWRRERDERLTPDTWALAVGALLLIPMLFVIMEVLAHYFNCRYGIGSIAGIGMMGAFAIAAGYRRDRALHAGLVVFLAVLFLWHGVSDLRELRHQHVEQDPLMLKAETESDLPIVVTDAIPYLPLWWYAPEGVKRRVVYLTDRAEAMRSGRPVPEIALEMERPYIAAPIQGFQAFLASHRRFLVLAAGEEPPHAMPARLRDAGYTVTLLDSGGSRLYEARR